MIELRQMYETKTFAELFDDYSDFKTEYTSTQKFPMIIDADDGTELNPKTSNLQILYYLLYARFGNSPIANYDENQFKTKIGSVIWQYGPAWESRLKVQAKVRALLTPNPITGKLDDLLTGSKAIHNHAYNPATEPSTASLDELTYINDQNTTQYKKSKMDAYAQLWGLVVTDVTEEFLAKFKPLFKTFVKPGTYLYESED